MTERTDVTPQPRRRLGLRLPKGASTPGLRRQTVEPTKTPLTEANQRPGELDTVATPRACLPKFKASSTNCRRLGLSRRRTDLSKKRLEFAALADRAEHTAPIETTENPNQTEWRQRKLLELQADIEIWKCGFIAAMRDLQTLAPAVPKATLLTQLQIPLEMLAYLDEETDLDNITQAQ